MGGWSGGVPSVVLLSYGCSIDVDKGYVLCPCVNVWLNADHTGYVDYYGDVVDEGTIIDRRVDVRSWVKIDFIWKVESDSTFEIRLSKANLRYGEEAARDTAFAQGDTFKYFLQRSVADTLEFYSCGYFRAQLDHVYTESCDGREAKTDPAYRLTLAH